MSNSTAIKADDFVLSFSMGEHGWCHLHICDYGARNENHHFWISDVFSDAVGELLHVCRSILNGQPVRVALCDEPGGIVLEVVPDKKQHHFLDLSIFDISGEHSGFGPNAEGERILEVKLRKRYLLGLIMSDLWRTQWFLAEPSFKKNRGSFPFQELRAVNQLWDDSPLGPSFLK